MTARLLTARQVAARLGRTLDWWYRNRKALEAQGFPKPPIRDRWHGPSIEAWLAERSRGPAASIVIAPANFDRPLSTEDELAARAAKIAGGEH